MKKKFLIIFITVMIIMLFASCSSSNYIISSTDNSKVLATVDNVKITQQQVDTRKKDSDFSQQGKVFSDKEVLDKIIEEKLLLIKAKELNITMSDDEVKKNYDEMLKQMNYTGYSNLDANKIDRNTLEALRNTFIIQKTREKLGSDVDQVLNQLRQEIKIKYYD